MATKRKIDHIKQTIGNANNINDLLPILGYLSFENIQSFAYSEADSWNESVTNKTYWKSTSINHLLPNDIIQNILSFNTSQSNNKFVCKSWNKLCKKNRKLILKQDESKAIMDESNVRTYVIDENRSELTLQEKSKGYLGVYRHPHYGDCPFDDIHVPSNRFLIHKGRYTYDIYYDYHKEYEHENKRGYYEFIGLDDPENIVIEFAPYMNVGECFSGIYLEGNCKYYFENITFESEISKFWGHEVLFDVREDTELVLKNCIINLHGYTTPFRNWGKIKCIGCNFKNDFKYFVNLELIDCVCDMR